jgi:hypothetical protein
MSKLRWVVWMFDPSVDPGGDYFEYFDTKPEADDYAKREPFPVHLIFSEREPSPRRR